MKHQAELPNDVKEMKMRGINMVSKQLEKEEAQKKRIGDIAFIISIIALGLSLTAAFLNQCNN